MKFRPLHDRVVIERIDAEAKTAGGRPPDCALQILVSEEIVKRAASKAEKHRIDNPHRWARPTRSRR
jgi:co-chaperonin GroES (HSP10)